MDPMDIKIQAEPTSGHDEECKFTIDRPIYPNGAVFFGNPSMAAGSPLAEVLFGDEDLNLATLLVAEDKIVVNLVQRPGIDWRTEAKKIATHIREQICSGEAAISPNIKEALPPSEEIKTAVQTILEEEINPAVASHGGFITLLGVEGNNVFIQLGGGCQGCGMANVTLKYGIEKVIRERVPAVGEILDSTDHASGRNPFYQQSKK